MRISVALATHNAERFLGDLLHSLAGQTTPPHELVVHDDASDDTTVAHIGRFAHSAPFPVRLERGNTRRGPTEAFIAAARRCEGELVAFCDQDDVWLERKVEVCAKQLASTGASLLMHSATLVDDELRPLGRDWPDIHETRSVEPLRLTGLDTDAPGMTMVLRRELLDLADFAARPRSRYGNGERMLHDEWVFLLAGAAGPIRLVAEPLVLYRQHSANHSGGWIDRRRALSLQPAIDDYRRAAEHTAECADYLERSGAPGLADGVASYRRAEANWRLRLSLYAAGRRRDRARLLRRLVAAGAYGTRSAGGFGRAALGKDLGAGLALAVRTPDDR